MSEPAPQVPIAPSAASAPPAEPADEAPRAVRGDAGPGRARLVISLALCLYGLALWAVGLGVKDFHAPMESSRAVVSREMLRTGEYIIPVLDGQPYLIKPPLFYWTVVAASSVRGEVTAFSARLPSALSAIALSILVFLVLDGLWSRAQSVGAAVATATSPLVYEKATSGELNMLFALLIAASLVCLLRFRTDERRRLVWFLLSTVAFGLAVLTKGPPALLFWVPAGLVYLKLDGGLRLLRDRRLLWALPLLAAILLPWPVATVARYGWRQCWDVFYAETFPRTWQAGKANVAPWWFYLVNLPLALMPWTAFALLTFWRSYRGRLAPGARSAVLFCQTAGVLSTVLFSLFQAREMRYMLPVAPMLLALGAHAAFSEPDEFPSRWMRRYVRVVWGVFALVVALAAAGLPGVLYALYSAGMTAAVALFLLLAVSAAAVFRGGRGGRGHYIAAAGLLLGMLAWKYVDMEVGVPRTNARNSPRALCQAAHHLREQLGEHFMYLTPDPSMSLRYYADVPPVTSADLRAAGAAGLLVLGDERAIGRYRQDPAYVVVDVDSWKLGKRSFILARIAARPREGDLFQQHDGSKTSPTPPAAP